MNNVKIDLSTEELTAKIRERSSVYSSIQIGSNKILVNFKDYASSYGIDELGTDIMKKVDINDAFKGSSSDRLVIELEVL